MPILNNIVNAKLGTTQVSAIYRGAEKIWPSFTGLLDLYPNAAVAYSLRRLRSGYTGNAIRVRRSSDNAEQDIGFVSNVLDTASLLTFVGAGDGFVTTWYDQSGLTRNAIQLTANLQPLIVLSGSLYLVNSKVAIRNQDTRLLSIPSAVSVFNNVNKALLVSVNQRDVSQTNWIISFTTPTSFAVRAGQVNINQTYSTGGRRLDADSAQLVSSANVALSQQVIFISYIDWLLTTATNYIDGSVNGTSTSFHTSGNTSATNSASVSIGALTTGSQPFQGFYQEIIIYNTDQLANISGMNANINTFYGAY
jgi:hypothetical protein